MAIQETPDQVVRLTGLERELTPIRADALSPKPVATCHRWIPTPPCYSDLVKLPHLTELKFHERPMALQAVRRFTNIDSGVTP